MLLAWQRAAIALKSFGFVDERFRVFLRMVSRQPLDAAQRGFSLWLGVVLLLLAAVALVLAMHFVLAEQL